jgi:iron complex transport system ATP-binding protein
MSNGEKKRTERLETRGLGLRLGPTNVLKDVQLDFAAGRCTALLGPNGAGKSSLLALLAGDLAPSQGRVRMGRRAPHRLGVAELAARRAMLVQRSELAHPFTVDRVVELGCPGAPRALRGLILAELDIEALAPRIYTELSGGEQRLVQLARVLLHCETLEPPGWLFLDEPESHLDLGVVQRVMQAARRRAERGMGVVAALHDLELASRWADDVVVLDGGSLRARGTARDALTAPVVSEVWRTPVEVTLEGPGARGVRIRVRPAAAPADGIATTGTATGTSPHSPPSSGA